LLYHRSFVGVRNIHGNHTAVDLRTETCFAGRTALITGGGRGIGREIALAFAGLGADLIIASRNADNLAATAGDIEASGRRC